MRESERLRVVAKSRKSDLKKCLNVEHNVVVLLSVKQILTMYEIKLASSLKFWLKQEAACRL